MRYTRYEYKKYGKVKFIVKVVLVVVVSIGSGLYISRFIFSGKNIPDSSVSTSQNVLQNDSETVQDEEIMALQCGYYSKKENADICIPTISSYCHPLIVEEDGKYRVIAGIYDKESGNKKIDELKSKGIDVAKIKIDMKQDTIEDKKVFQIVEGFLAITDKLEESDVKSIKTAEFKNWADSIINDGKSNNSERLNNIQSYVNSLPDEITKSNTSNSTEVLYTLIKK